MAAHDPVYSDRKGLGEVSKVKSLENLLSLPSRKAIQELTCFFTWEIQEEVNSPPELCQKNKR